MIIGHSTIKKLFANAIRRENLAHAYLFVGPEGVGKKTFALDLAKSINKSKGFDADLKFIDENSGDKTYSISIEEMRDLKRFLSFKPYMGSYKIAVIDNAHLMETAAQNSILKILEEPSSYTLIILITDNDHHILEPVRSRCQTVKFKPISSKLIENNIFDKGINTEDAKLILEVADGRAGYAIRMTQGESVNKIKKSIEAFKKLQKAPLSSKFNYAKKLLEEGDLDEQLNYWIKYLRGDILGNRFILQKALELNHLIQQPKFNKRLALENFLIHV